MPRNPVVLGQPRRRHVRGIGREIQLGTIARRQDRGFVHGFGTRQIRQRLLQFLGVKSHLLTHRKRCRVVVDTKRK